MKEESSGGVSARQILSRAANLMRATRGNWKFMLLLVGAPALIVFLYSLPVGQSYVVEARTLGAQVTIRGAGASWKLPELSYCQPLGRDRDLRKAAAFRGAGCNPGLFNIHRLPGAEIRIPPGVQILIRSEPDGSMVLRRLAVSGSNPKAASGLVLDHELSWEPNAIVQLEAVSWKQVSLLEFVGDVVIGEEVGSGVGGYLIGGRYDVRERFIWHPKSIAPTTVFEGSLLRGDRVAFHKGEEDEEVLLTGFIAPYLEENARGFGIVVSTGLDAARSKVGVKSFGTREVLVAPNWTDRARRDPLLLALTAILGFALTSLTFAVEVRKIAISRERS